jgi:hypothetical protein
VRAAVQPSTLRYDKARQIKEQQDAYCQAAVRGDWTDIAGRAFPDDLQWEAMVDILRGKVKVQAHCYEPVDLDGLIRVRSSYLSPTHFFLTFSVRLSQIANEFKFPIGKRADIARMHMPVSVSPQLLSTMLALLGWPQTY